MKINFNRGPSISISASPDDWELYDVDTEEQEQERDYVVDQINWGIENIICQNTEPLKAYKEGNELLFKFKRWGADDTESRATLARIIETAYGTKL
jgi:hypothetical protein